MNSVRPPLSLIRSLWGSASQTTFSRLRRAPRGREEALRHE